jgi:hypothetical protein
MNSNCRIDCNFHRDQKPTSKGSPEHRRWWQTFCSS